LDNKVVKLLRYSYGDLHLPESLKPGEYRQLTSQEIQSLKNAVGLKD
jgi:16S rRNA U516 pseudouridylate synthase RsuA-like enzyme